MTEKTDITEEIDREEMKKEIPKKEWSENPTKTENKMM
jgi:hypothetical protein